MNFRNILFWAHLAAGIISGLSIGIMCFTGTVLAFEKEIVAWAERDARRVEAPAFSTARLSLEEMQRRLRESHPDARPMSIVFQNDPHAAVAFSSGRSGGFYVNPYTGEVRQPKSSTMGTFMHTMVDWHRYLGFHGEVSRPRGKLINGICNVAFCVLAMSGLYLWMPRSWSWRGLRPIVWFRQNSSSKARDFNWHNTIGFWTAPILIVLTLTAIPISFRWGGNLIYTLTGTEAPAAGPGGQGSALAAGPTVEIPAFAPGTATLSPDALLAAVQKQVPKWTTITLRTGNTGAGGRGGAAGRGERAVEGRGGPNAGARPTATNGEARAARPQAVTFTVREASSWPRTATTTLMFNPYNGELLRRSGYADLNAAQQVRSWTRFLHTGEAIGWLGQLVAGLACLGGVFLVYTGFALSWRRFFGQRLPISVTATDVDVEQSAQPPLAGRIH
jgi:uncharacterized iron-regulated membrane protein